MRDLDLWVFSARLRATLFVALAGFIFGGASMAVAIGAPDSFQSARGRHVTAKRLVDPGTLADGRGGQATIVQPALTITKVVRRDHNPRDGRHTSRGLAGGVPARIRPSQFSRGEPAVLVANAANITRLCRYLL